MKLRKIFHLNVAYTNLINMKDWVTLGLVRARVRKSRY